MGKEYTVAGEAEYSAIRYIIDSTMSIFEREILVFPDDEQICALMAEAGQRVNPDEYEVFIGYQLEKALTEEQMETVRALMELGGLNREAIRFKSEEMSAFIVSMVESFCRNVSGSTLSHGNGYDHLLQTDVGRVRRPETIPDPFQCRSD